MASVLIRVNGTPRTVEADPATPLLWVLRDLLNLTGTKYGCGRGLCGACTVHMNGAAVRSCQVPLSAEGQRRRTADGLRQTPRCDQSPLLHRSWC